MAAGGGDQPAKPVTAPPQLTTASSADKWTPLRDYLHSFEDGALAAGGLLATIAGSLGKGSDPGTGLVLVGLGFAAIGKAVPSLVTDLGPASDLKKDPSRNPASDPKKVRFWFLSPVGDALLVIVAALSFVVYGLSSYSLTDFLIVMGAAFMSKAVVDIAHDILLAYPEKGKPGIAAPGGPTEDLLFLVFGLTAILLTIHGFESGLGATPALGIAALGKALPSLLQSGSPGGGGGPGK